MTDRAEELRQVFDRAFAAPTRAERDGDGEAALLVRAGAEPYVVLLDATLSAVSRLPEVTPLPGGGTAQLGLVGLRGELVVAFSLPALLGYEGTFALDWLLRIGGPSGVALAFDVLEGQARLPPSARIPAGPGERRHVSGLARLPGEHVPRPVLDLGSVLDRLGVRP